MSWSRYCFRAILMTCSFESRCVCGGPPFVSFFCQSIIAILPFSFSELKQSLRKFCGLLISWSTAMSKMTSAL